MSKTINLTLKVWRQEGPEKKGRLETYSLVHDGESDG